MNEELFPPTLALLMEVSKVTCGVDDEGKKTLKAISALLS
jgi:hypothetical protein